MNKVVDLNSKRKGKYFDKIKEIISILDDYNTEMAITEEEILIILEELYNLYRRKSITYHFLEDMLDYFNTICESVVNEDIALTPEIIYNGLLGCYNLMAPVEVRQRDIYLAISIADKRIKSKEKDDEERKYYKKL